MGVLSKHKIVGGLVVGLGLLMTLAPTASAATLSASDRYAAVDKAVAYLASQQAADGSLATFDDKGEWAAVALSAAGVNIDTVKGQGVSLLQYFKNTKNLDPASSRYAYDIEQRLLALNAAKFDPTSFEGVNYDSLLKAQYDSQAILNSSTTYDDIFGVMILSATKDVTLKTYLPAAVDNLVSYQQADGGFCSQVGCAYGEDVDSTAMAYGALAAAQTAGVTTTTGNILLSSAMTKAHTYIFATESNNLFGSYGPNYSTTALVAAALSTAGEDTNDIAAAIMAGQDTNGGIKYDNSGQSWAAPSIYNTDFGILALLGTNWLLNPTPIVRPAPTITTNPSPSVVTEPNPTPAPVVQAHAIIPYVSYGPATPAPVEQVAAAETSTPNSNPPAEVTNNQNSTAKKANNTLKYVGYGLIALATAGLGGYFWLTRRPKE